MVLCCDVTEAKLNLFVFLLRERYVQYVVCFVFAELWWESKRTNSRGQEGFISLSYLFPNFVGHHPKTK